MSCSTTSDSSYIKLSKSDSPIAAADTRPLPRTVCKMETSWFIARYALAVVHFHTDRNAAFVHEGVRSSGAAPSLLMHENRRCASSANTREPRIAEAASN